MKKSNSRRLFASDDTFRVFYIADNVKGKADLFVRLRTLHLLPKEYLDQTVSVCVTNEKSFIPTNEDAKENSSISKGRFASSRLRKLVGSSKASSKSTASLLLQSAKKLCVPVWSGTKFKQWLRTREKKAGITEHSSVDMTADYGPCKYARMVIEDLSGHLKPLIKIFKPDALGRSTVPKFYPKVPRNVSFFSHPWERTESERRCKGGFGGAEDFICTRSATAGEGKVEEGIAAEGQEKLIEEDDHRSKEITDVEKGNEGGGGGGGGDNSMEKIIEGERVSGEDDNSMKRINSTGKRTSKENVKSKRKSRSSKLFLKRKRKSQVEKEKNHVKGGGYCECCRVHYKSLAEHLTTVKHRMFEEDNKNYEELDSVITSFKSNICQEKRGIHRLMRTMVQEKEQSLLQKYADNARQEKTEEEVRKWETEKRVQGEKKEKEDLLCTSVRQEKMEEEMERRAEDEEYTKENQVCRTPPRHPNMSPFPLLRSFATSIVDSIKKAVTVAPLPKCNNAVQTRQSKSFEKRSTTKRKLRLSISKQKKAKAERKKRKRPEDKENIQNPKRKKRIILQSIENKHHIPNELPRKEDKAWTCEFCGDNFLSTYDDVKEHELICRKNPNRCSTKKHEITT
eukprot:g1360.t1